MDTLTAVGLCAEIGDFERFARAEQLMSYIGLVPSDQRPGTAVGSGRSRRPDRRTLVGCWSKPRCTTAKRRRSRKTLAERQKDQPPEAVAIAWTAQRRLHRTWTRLEARNKRRTLIAVAAARELVGFCWAITQIE